jgi:hypothetical protein
MTNKAFLDCYIWVLGAFDYEIKNEQKYYKLKNIFFYNSLNDRSFKHQNDLSSYSFEIQIPEFVIKKVTRQISEKVIKKEMKPPFLKMVNGGWELV